MALHKYLFLLVALALTTLVACAQGQPGLGGFDSPADDPDTGGDPLPPDPGDDASPLPAPAPQPDAGPTGPEPDAGPTEPDAGPTEPDAGEPDAPPAPVCPTEPCDLLEQCGCPDALACDLDEENLPATSCREITAPGRENDTCEVLADCDAGYVCVSGSCRPYCSNGSECDGPRGQCIISLSSDTGESIPGVLTCSSNCDPNVAVHPECPNGFGCRLRRLASSTEYTSCEPAGLGGDGASCSSSTECRVGLQCIGGSCLEICNTVDTTCPVGRGCFQLNPPFFIGAVEYGFCL